MLKSDPVPPVFVIAYNEIRKGEGRQCELSLEIELFSRLVGLLKVSVQKQLHHELGQV